MIFDKAENALLQRHTDGRVKGGGGAWPTLHARWTRKTHKSEAYFPNRMTTLITRLSAVFRRSDYLELNKKNTSCIHYEQTRASLRVDTQTGQWISLTSLISHANRPVHHWTKMRRNLSKCITQLGLCFIHKIKSLEVWAIPIKVMNLQRQSRDYEGNKHGLNCTVRIFRNVTHGYQ